MPVITGLISIRYTNWTPALAVTRGTKFPDGLLHFHRLGKEAVDGPDLDHAIAVPTHGLTAISRESRPDDRCPVLPEDADVLAVRQLPQSNRGVGPGRQGPLTVGRQGDRADGTVMAGQSLKQLCRLGVPQTSRSVVAPGDDLSAVGREGH